MKTHLEILGRIKIIEGDCRTVLPTLAPASVDLIYIDPPFNTGNEQTLHGRSYSDTHEDYRLFMDECLRLAKDVMKPRSSIFVHLDFREAHHVRMLLDTIFGAGCFQNEIIWSYDFGGRSKKRWPRKHNNIYWYTKNAEDWTFNYDAIDRIPYRAPKFALAMDAGKTQMDIERGKIPTDVWWNTIVHFSEGGTLYPTQKPQRLLRRIVEVHSNKGDVLLDFFAGSGSFGQAAVDYGRQVILVDNNSQAIEVMLKRFSAVTSPISCL